MLEVYKTTEKLSNECTFRAERAEKVKRRDWSGDTQAWLVVTWTYPRYK